jgi:hypothetical protein
MVDEAAQNLLLDLMAWRPGEDLRPLLQRTIEVVGPTTVIHLSTDPKRARAKLIDAVEDYMEGF